MTLEEIESMELTDEFIEQVGERDGIPASLALLAFREARMQLDDNGENREMAKEQTRRYYQEYKIAHRPRTDVICLLLKAIDVLADFRAKKAANPHADQSKGLTANDTTGNGCCEHCTTAAGGKQEEE